MVVADREGWFRVVDRVKEIIKYKGHQVAPAGLEAILLAHPAVADAAVSGCPDEEAGEIPTAFVVLGQPATADRADVVRCRAGRAAREDPPGGVRRPDIPKSPSGKILRRLLGRARASSPGPAR